MRAISSLLLATALLAMAPAMAQDATATLRARGSVMVSSGGEFITARDGQPVIAGQRILVGENASATVEYDRDCKRSFDTAGVHLIPPGRCDDDDDRDDDDRSQEREQQSVEQGGSAEASATASGTSQLTTLAVALGGVVAGAGLMEQREESLPDHPISR